MYLPDSASHLQSAWAGHPSAPNHAKEAWWNMLEFLKANGIKGSDVTKEVVEMSKDQWCSKNPERCRGLRRGKRSPYLPWAKAAWEDANARLAGTVDHPGLVLASIVSRLTSLINGPEGCPLCARHWRDVLAKSPAPSSPTLDEARHWLVNAHNETREGKAPTPFAEVAAKFNWIQA